MGAVLVAWIAAAMAALRAAPALASCAILDSTSVGFEEVGGADLIMLGDDEDERGLTATLEGDWRDAGPFAAQSGAGTVVFTIVSQSGDAMTAVDRFAALNTLVTAVTTALVPSAGGSNLGVDHVTGAMPAGLVLNQVMTSAGIRIAVATLTVRVDLYA